jgi:hypothetical protein
MTLSCGHAIGYKLSSAHRPACLACTPPRTRPNAIGIVQPDGSLMTAVRLRAGQLRASMAAQRSATLAHTRHAWPDGGWEEVDEAYLGPIGPDGWPVNSTAGLLGKERIGRFTGLLRVSR